MAHRNMGHFLQFIICCCSDNLKLFKLGEIFLAILDYYNKEIQTNISDGKKFDGM